MGPKREENGKGKKTKARERCTVIRNIENQEREKREMSTKAACSWAFVPLSDSISTLVRTKLGGPKGSDSPKRFVMRIREEIKIELQTEPG